MASRIFPILFLMFATVSIRSQEISRNERDSLVNALSKTKSDVDRIELLLDVAQFYIFKPGEDQIDFDSAAVYIKKAKELIKNINSSALNGYLLLTESYLEKERGPKSETPPTFRSPDAKKIVEQAIAILETSGNKLFLGKAYFELSSYYSYADNKELEERIRLLEKALLYFQQTSNKERIGTSLYVLGDLYQIHGDFYKSLQYLKKSLIAFDSAHHIQVQGVYTLMGSVSGYVGENNQALKYALTALQIAQNVGDTSIQLCQINNDIARSLTKLNEHEKALKYFMDALTIAEKYRDIFSIYLVGSNLAGTWATLGKPNEALNILNRISATYKKPDDPMVDYDVSVSYLMSYSSLKQFSKAQYYCDKLLALAEKKADVINIFSTLQIYYYVIKYYIFSGHYPLAIKYLNQHKTLAAKSNDIYLMSYNEKLRFMLDTAQHHYNAAVDHLLSFDRMKDSVFNQTESKQIAGLQVEFETEQKAKDILVKDQSIKLLTKQDELQKTKLQQASVLRNISFGGLGLLIIIISLLYNRYRVKQRTNKKLESQRAEIENQNVSLHHLINEKDWLLKEKDWLLKEIHHRVKNNLQTVMSLLISQSAYIDNESALLAIHDSQLRVNAMALIHQKLYSSENVSSIDISLYIRELSSYLSDSFNTSRRIRFEYSILPLEMDVSRAVPLGLILNEAITNSLKYAFPNDRMGVISISLQNISDRHYLLMISDNGIGISTNFTAGKPGSLGLSLMTGLSEDLDGNFSITGDDGTTVKILFTYDPRTVQMDTSTALILNN